MTSIIGESWDRETSMFFTGHRPKDLGRCYSVHHPNFLCLKEKAKPVIKAMVQRFGIKHLIFGGAQGWDQISFWASYELKKQGDIASELVIAVPYKSQPDIWKWDNFEYEDVQLGIVSDDKLRDDQLSIKYYYTMLGFANKVVYVDSLDDYKMKRVPAGQYHVAKLDIRNHFMVDMARYGFALWNRSLGGTEKCLRYALKKECAVMVMNPWTHKLEVLKEMPGNL